jgi:thymidylate synthase (FAD)
MKTFLVGVTQPDLDGVKEYLRHTDQLEFLEEFIAYPAPLNLVSMFAKLCYKSLVLGKNANVTRIREVEKNLIAVINSGHGSVFEHVTLNFITTDCSRVFTHELVRHRVGTAFSQTSGRYVALDNIQLVLPPELQGDPGVTALVSTIEATARDLRERLIKDGDDFNTKKRITSAIRRIAPNGQTNEIAWSCNVRTLRHLISLRTSEHAEWEIHQVFTDVRRIVQERWPMMLYTEDEKGELRI